MTDSGPLEGLVVVAVEQAVAAPFATRQLADLGARVIKVERPGSGDFARSYDDRVRGMSSYFVWLNRSKESLAVDLKSGEGRAFLGALVDRADVVVQNLAPGAAARLGLDAVTLRSRRPELIHCSISGYGAGGPLEDAKAYDLLIQCESGLLSLTGTADQPARVGVSIADIAAGMYAYTGILTALLRRGRTGEGSTVEVSMLEALAEWLGNPLYYARYGGEQPRRTGAAHPSIAPYGPFPVAAGAHHVFLAVQNEPEWARFCALVLERPALAEDPRFSSNPRRVAARSELDELVGAALRDIGLGEAERRLDAARIAHARMRDMHGLIGHEQLSARGRWGTISSPVGALDALLPPVDIDGIAPVMGAVPAVGEHTEAIARELGLPTP